MTVTTNPRMTGAAVGSTNQPSSNHIFGANTPKATDRDGIGAAQQRVGAGALVLDGVDVVGGQWPCGFSGGRRLTVYSAGNLSARTFTVDGFDKDDLPISEDFAGPNAGTTTGTKFFKRVTGWSVDGTIASDAELGFAASLVALKASEGPGFTLSPAAGETVYVAMYGGAGVGFETLLDLKLIIPGTGSISFANGTTPSDVTVTWVGPSPTLTPSTTKFFTFMNDGTTSGGDDVWYGDERDFSTLPDHDHSSAGVGGNLDADAFGAADKTGTGDVVLQTSPTINTPTIDERVWAHRGSGGGQCLVANVSKTSYATIAPGGGLGDVAVDKLYAMRLRVKKTITINKLSNISVVKATAGGLARFGIYTQPDGGTLWPDALVAGTDEGAVATDVADGAEFYTDLDPAVTLAPGDYWVVVTFGVAAPSIYGVNAYLESTLEHIVGIKSNYDVAACIRVDRAFAALPATFPAATGNDYIQALPLVFMRPTA